MSFLQLFFTNLKLVYRNRSGVFWTLAMPLGLYSVLSVLPISGMAGGTVPYSTFLLPGMVALTVMQHGIYGLAYWMVDLRTRGVIKRFLVTPIKQWELALSVVCARLVVIVVQVAALTVVGVGFFGATFNWNILSILLFTLMGGAIFLMLGLLISTMADSYESAAPITTGIGLPLTFLGNVFFPSSSLPHWLSEASRLLPITYLADGMRKMYLETFSWQAVKIDYAALLFWLVIMLILVLWRFRLRE